MKKYGIRDLCKYFGVDTRTLRRWYQREDNPMPISAIGKQRFILEEDLIAWIRSLQGRPSATGRRLRKAKEGRR